MKLYNSLSRKVEVVLPLRAPSVSIYSCGPTVYDRVHIGNLSAFIAADVMRRVLSANDFSVTHVMNLTDVDDKTIKRSREEYTDLEPNIALAQTTAYYTAAFLRDSELIGNDTGSLELIRATDPATIHAIQDIIEELHVKDIAYIADDGIYFSIKAYQAAGKVYGQLVDITTDSTSTQRIQNDEYDKESAHDFALWKFAKSGEPSWNITIADKTYVGRPGWHIECSAMSRLTLGQPFDIHTGGIDLKFPHHENEIAQSTACSDSATLAKMFVHNEHVLVDGRKMSKSLSNFYTLEDLKKQNINPLAFRMLVLQSHYRNPTNFSFETLASAAGRLENWRSFAVLRHQIHDTVQLSSPEEPLTPSLAASGVLVERLSNDLDTPAALTWIDEVFSSLANLPLDQISRSSLVQFLETIDMTLGLGLSRTTPDISDDVKQRIIERERARDAKDWARSDELRDEIMNGSTIEILDTPTSTLWRYV